MIALPQDLKFLDFLTFAEEVITFIADHSVVIHAMIGSLTHSASIS